MVREWKNFEVHDRKDLGGFEETVDGNMEIRGVLVRSQK